MVLPNFLVIGGQRCGTTLLHTILAAHEEVYVPTRRKEIHFFDCEDRFARGLDWYQAFFPSEQDAARYRAIGEVTPDYLFEPKAAPRIAQLMPDCRLIAVLRDPVDRVFSGYLHHVRAFGERRSFEQFIEQQADAMQRGFYTGQLQHYLELFGRHKLHIAIFEELLRDPENNLQTLAAFLNLSHSWRDPAALIQNPINSGATPRFHAAFLKTRRLGEVLSEIGLDRVVTLAKDAGLLALFGARPDRPRMANATRARLREAYRGEIMALEQLLGRPIDAWRQRT